MLDGYLNLIKSDRVGVRTREVLLDRMNAEGQGAVPKIETGIDVALLRAVVDRLIPRDPGEGNIEIASVLASQSQANLGDGWRFADMPPDRMALELGLRLLDDMARHENGASFAALQPAGQDALLCRVASGAAGWTELDARHWFEDLLAQATEIYVSQPATLAQLGFSGIAFLPKWPTVGLNTTQPWEPSRR